MNGRDALVRAVLPTDEAGLPAPDLSAFWRRFDREAPAHLRLAVHAATGALAFAWPLARHGRPLAHLTRPEADALLERAAGAPGTAELLDVVKVVAALALFSEPEVQAAVRRR